jgi:hypothetical protein
VISPERLNRAVQARNAATVHRTALKMLRSRFARRILLKATRRSAIA